MSTSSEYSYPDDQQPKSKLWYKIKRTSEVDAENVIGAVGRVEYHDNMKNRHILKIKKLMKNDSAEYTFRHQTEEGGQKQSDLPGVTLVVTGM